MKQVETDSLLQSLAVLSLNPDIRRIPKPAEIFLLAFLQLCIPFFLRKIQRFLDKLIQLSRLHIQIRRITEHFFQSDGLPLLPADCKARLRFQPCGRFGRLYNLLICLMAAAAGQRQSAALGDSSVVQTILFGNQPERFQSPAKRPVIHNGIGLSRMVFHICLEPRCKPDLP